MIAYYEVSWEQEGKLLRDRFHPNQGQSALDQTMELSRRGFERVCCTTVYRKIYCDLWSLVPEGLPV